MKNKTKSGDTVTLKSVAEHVGLTAGTVSLVLNHAPQSKSIPQRTKDRIFAAASELNYQPNLLARALRTSSPPPRPMISADLNSSAGALMFGDAENLARAIHAIRQAGLRVPGDVSVVGANFPSAKMEHLVRAGEIA
jgi:DNA-binding LacI/PurR family transcriptional regulator